MVFGLERRNLRGRNVFFLVFALSLFLGVPTPAYAVGEGNIDNGGGSMTQGNSQNSWSPGNEGVRVTVVRAEGHDPVTVPIDLTNKKPKIVYSFGKVSKLSYTKGTALSVNTGAYEYVNPGQALPRIISSQSLGQANIQEIKSYFTDEQVVRSIAGLTGMDFETLINGQYRLLLEPVSYVKFHGNLIAFTATEAALYDEITSGGVRSMLPTAAFQNLPLSMFLEVSDLGYPAWSGPTTGVRSNSEIQSSLGIGIVRFKEAVPEEPVIREVDYEYRTNTEVITAVDVSGGQSDPDHPVSVMFQVGERSYTVDHVYYPNGDSQLAWIRWTTPDKPQTMTMKVQVHGGGRVEKGTFTIKVADLDENPPPDPNADDRNDGFTKPEIPEKAEVLSATWGIWRPWWQEYWVWHDGDDEEDGYWCDHGWWEFDLDRYSASLSATMRITTDEKAPTATGRSMKSGYGFQELVTTHVSTNQASAVTPAQNAVTYFPEFQYERFWRLLERMGSGYSMTHALKENEYSTYHRRTHFTPIWYPDGDYTPYTWLLDCWTPAGMLSVNLTDTIQIEGNLWSDWHIAPQAVH